MSAIVGIEKIREILPQFTFHHFRILREFRFYKESEEEGVVQKVNVILESESLSPNYRLLVCFGHVRGVRINDFGGGETRLVGFDVIDISDRQWDSIEFQVVDFENKMMELFCKTVEVELHEM